MKTRFYNHKQQKEQIEETAKAQVKAAEQRGPRAPLSWWTRVFYHAILPAILGLIVGMALFHFVALLISSLGGG